MALVFDYNNIKVDFLSKRLDNPNDKYNTKTILFPVLRYKVFAPSVKALGLNIFQKSVLSILNKGKFDIQKISSWLKLDTQLIQMIFAELIQKSFISSNGEITDAGRALIEGSFSWFDNAEDIKKDIYYIYQDIYSQNLYPVLMKFDTSRDFFEYENRKIKIGSKGKNKAIPVTLLESKSIRLDAIQQPEVEEIFQVIKKHSKIEKISGGGVPPNLIQYIDNEATVAYLATTIYIDKEDYNIDNIKVLDPFGIDKDVSFWLKDSLKNASNKNDKIKNLFNKLVIDAKKEYQKQMGDAFKDVKKEAIEIIENTFDSNLKLYDELYKSIEEFYRDLVVYDHHKDGKYLKEAFKNSQTILETLFDSIYKENQSGYLDVLKADTKLNSVDVEIIKAKVMRINPNCQFPNLRFSNFNGIKKAMQNKPISLRAGYVAAILASWYDRDNCMYRLLTQKNNLLLFLEKIIDERNGVAHKYKDIPNRKMNKHYDELLEAKSGIEEIIKIFLEGK
jgi:uncharacterized protein YutE (UPF0331/DUF86 family)/predicted transcriptional regulator